MADNVIADAGAGGATFATDDVAGVHYPITKLAYGALDSATIVTTGASALPVQDGGNAITVDWAGTAPPIGAGVEATALRVTLATDSTGVVSVDDNGGALTVDGTVAISGAVDTELTTGDLDTGAGTDTRAVVGLVGSKSGGGELIPGSATDGLLVNLGANNDVTLASTTITGTVAVTQSGTWDEVGINDSGNAITVDWAGTAPPIGAGLEATALRVTVATDSTGVLSVDDNAGSLTVDGTVTANLAAGTNNIGDVDVLSIAAGDNNIGNVDIVSLPASTNTLEVVGDVAHDAGASGNPVLVCGVAQNGDDTAPPNRISAESDATRLATDWDGAIYARPHGPQIWSYHSDGSTALTDASVHAAPGAGLSLYVTDIVVSSGAATAMNVFFEESTTKVLGPYYLEAVAGRGLALHFQTPKKITANTALTVTTSAAIAHAVDVTGFTGQG